MIVRAIVLSALLASPALAMLPAASPLPVLFDLRDRVAAPAEPAAAPLQARSGGGRREHLAQAEARPSASATTSYR